MAPAPSTFPNYDDGDVKIVLTGGLHLTLHSTVLTNNSSVIAKLLTAVEPAPLTNKVIKNGFFVRWKLVLAKDPEDHPPIEYFLTPIELDANGRPPRGTLNSSGSLDFPEGKPVPSLIPAYVAVLGAFYNIPIDIGDSWEDNLTNLLSTALDILKVAEYLDCVRIIPHPIDACLQATGQNLHKAIQNNPTAWLAFATRVRSRIIYREALIHAAGQYNTPHVQAALDRGDLDHEVAAVLHRKGNDIIRGVTQAERHFASYYPSVIMREAPIGRADQDKIGRANYGNDIMIWIALCAFRHWLADQIASDRSHHAEDMGFVFINSIVQGGEAYLPRKLMHDFFHKRFPMSPKGMACVEHRLSEIKENVKQWARPLLVNQAGIDPMRNPTKFFTHIHVDTADYPWLANKKEDTDELIDDDGYDDYDDDNGYDQVMSDADADADADDEAADNLMDAVEDGDSENENEDEDGYE